LLNQIKSNNVPLFEILNQIKQFSPFSKVTITCQVVSTVLWYSSCDLCCRQATVFFQYLVDHSGPI